MLFTSPSFLFIFLPLSIFFYSMTPNHLKKYTLLAFSIIFYLFLTDYNPIALLLLFMLMMYTYLAGREIRASGRKSVIAFFVVLEFFGFFLYRILLHLLDDGKGPFLGVSFFVLASVSYMFDIYRKNTLALPSFFDTALFISFFPILIAGPVVKYKDFLLMLEKRSFKVESLSRGVILFCIGFIKKTVVSATLAKSIESFIEFLKPEMTLGALFFISVFLFINAIFDLWGYSDMARGVSLMFGLYIPENFKNCLGTVSVSDFFRKFYISIREWVNDYIYTPLSAVLDRNKRLSAYFLSVFCSVFIALWFKTDLIMLAAGFVLGSVVYIEQSMWGSIRRPDNPLLNVFLRMLNIIVFAALFYLCSFSGLSEMIAYMSEVNYDIITTHTYLIYPSVFNLKFLFVLLVVLAVLFQSVFESAIKPKLNDRTLSVYRMIYNVLVIVVFAFSVLYFLPQNSELFSVPFEVSIF